MSLTETLDVRPGEAAHLVLRRATVLDPVAGIDGVYDVVVRDGEIAELAAPGAAATDGAELVEAEGLHAFPAFFDPHVHLRTPGHEHKEDVETGTRSAAAGGFCGILAMANTEPPVSTAADISALREQARVGASVPVGFLATVTKGMKGEELTEMVELREAGAIGFSDDGLPITSARMMRRALQYQRLCGGNIALHEEDPELSGDGVMHEGPVPAAVGLTGIPSVSESTMVARDAALAAYEEARIHVQHLSAAESVEVVRAAKAAGVQISAEAEPAPPLPDRRGGPQPRPAPLQDEPAAAPRARPPGVDRGPPRRHDRVCRHRPRAAPGGGKGGPLRASGDGGDRPRDRLRGAAHRARPPGCDRPWPAGRADGRRRRPVRDRAPLAGARLGGQRRALRPRHRVDGGEDGYESRSQNSWCAGRTLTGRVLVTVAAGQVAFRLRSFGLGVAS